tara:strand:- start:1667 stop:2263 length:597 start_codon:yes stop_codon:yes gene_type:complete
MEEVAKKRPRGLPSTMKFKTEASKNNWNQNKLGYILLIVVIVLVILWVNRLKLKESKGFSEKKGNIADGNGTAYAQGRGNDNDTVEELLDRIEWGSYSEQKVNNMYRYAGIVIISTALISILALRKLPKISTIIIIMIAVFVPMMAANSLYYVHGDIYSSYYIKDNAKRLRKKLNSRSYKEPPPAEDNLPTRAQVMNP